MNFLAAFWRSTIGKKVVMAVTGVIMIGFVIGHVSGNLLVFRGAEAFNHYAGFLKSLGGILYAARAGLLVSVVLHFTAAYQLTQLARVARPVEYTRREPQVSTWASRTMRWGGVLLLLFIVLHLAQFTLGWIDRDAFSETDVYNNVMIGFRNLWWVLFYELAMVMLGFHIFHGAWSSVRTLGVAKPSRHPLHRRVAVVLGVGVWLAFSIIPAGVYFGVAKPVPAPGASTAAVVPASAHDAARQTYVPVSATPTTP